MIVHIDQANARDLALDDIVEQGGIPYRVVYIEGFHNSFGFHAERVYFIPTHDGDGNPMENPDVYSAPVHVPSQTLGQIRWWGPPHALRARMVAGR